MGYSLLTIHRKLTSGYLLCDKATSIISPLASMKRSNSACRDEKLSLKKLDLLLTALLKYSIFMISSVFLRTFRPSFVNKVRRNQTALNASVNGYYWTSFSGSSVLVCLPWEMRNRFKSRFRRRCRSLSISLWFLFSLFFFNFMPIGSYRLNLCIGHCNRRIEPPSNSLLAIKEAPRLFYVTSVFSVILATSISTNISNILPWLQNHLKKFSKLSEQSQVCHKKIRISWNSHSFLVQTPDCIEICPFSQWCDQLVMEYSAVFVLIIREISVRRFFLYRASQRSWNLKAVASWKCFFFLTRSPWGKSSPVRSASTEHRIFFDHGTGLRKGDGWIFFLLKRCVDDCAMLD